MTAQQTSAEQYTILVGVDGSAASAHLLRWARDYALQFHGRIRAVLGWQPPEFANLVSFRAEVNLVRSAEERLQRLVADNTVGVPSESAVIEGSPARILLREAKGADMLLIGRHTAKDRNGSAVARQCADSCPCPLIVVPFPTGGERS